MYNAVKFNHENGWIEVKGKASGDSMVIEVADSGVGIAEKDLPHIFDRFYQGQEPGNTEGIGVGLSLVNEFTRLHHGDVTVTSKLNEGTRFTLTFPLGDASAATHAEESTPLPDVSLSEFERSTVLLVEDNDEMRFYLREILGTTVKTFEARNGREALKYLKDQTPDLIISDVMMPEMDGSELLKHLKGSEELKRIPVVVLTARAAEEDLLHFLNFGVDDYIVKPFNARELKIRIHNLLSNQELRKQWNSKPIEDEEKESTPTETDVFLKRVREFVGSNISNPNPGIGDLADHMAMSERQLYRKCGAIAGMTPAQLIKDIKLDIAWQQLISKKVTKVSELARSLGYENVSYFSRLFSERYGKRPADLM
jgi:CheY-like chemotaxis protein